MTEQEEGLIVYLGKEPKSAEQAAEYFGISITEAEQRLNNAYHRANVNKSRGDQALYLAASLYDRLGYYTQYEHDDWMTIPADDRKIIDEWYVAEFTNRLKKQIDADKDNFYRDDVLPVDSAIEAIEKIAGGKPDAPFYLTPCNCRTTANNCHFSVETCLSNYYGINGQWDRGYGRQVTLDDVRLLMRQWDKEGLMHTVSPSGHICSCETCCCYEFRAALKLGTKGIYPRVRYVASVDKDKCIHCGICAKRCHFGAFHKNADGVVEFKPELCWGCGICEVSCGKKAIAIAHL
ncbi:MAG: 4Fe-4S binding protein [Peptococcaceae bacterium]|nr:4Fe-4S binding protein [Peptococcaceae bacterium]